MSKKIYTNSVGPAGPTGPQGGQGQLGPTGPTGPAGPGSFDITIACVNTVNISDVVTLSGPGLVNKADASANFPAVGIVVNKIDPTTAVVRVVGEVNLYLGLSSGSKYYLSESSGQITDVAPALSGTVVQVLGVAKDTTTLILNANSFYAVN